MVKPDEGWPPNCPIKTIGMFGGHFLYVDAMGQQHALEQREHSRAVLAGIFGRHTDWLEALAPEYNALGSVSGWRHVGLAERMMAAAATAGPIKYRMR